MDCDINELLSFSDTISEIAGDFPKETQRFLKEEAKKLRKETQTEAEKSVKRRTGNLKKGIKAGKIYRYKENDNLSVRVYAGRPAGHAHLLELGHKIVVPYTWRRKMRKSGGGCVKGRTNGRHFFQKAGNGFAGQFSGDCEEFLDRLLEGKIR